MLLYMRGTTRAVTLPLLTKEVPKSNRGDPSLMVSRLTSQRQ